MKTQAEERSDGPLSVRSARYGEEVVVVSLAGELDRSNVGTAKAVLGHVARADPTLLVIDLLEMEFLDASGLAMLVAVGDHRPPGTLRIVTSANPEVTRMLDLTGIGPLIRLHTDGDSATA